MKGGSIGAKLARMQYRIDSKNLHGLADELISAGMAGLVAGRITEQKGGPVHDSAPVRRMSVLVTGASGFLGCHMVAALQDLGHDVRIIARSQARAHSALAAVGADVAAVDTRAGDLTDPEAVEDALLGCDAVVHAAATVALDARRAKSAFRENVRAGELVLAAAHRLGLDPIVHVSGVPALLPCRDLPLSPDSPVGDPPRGYLRSKAALERIARALQAEGAAVVIVQPGLQLGPHDPKLGMGTSLVRDAVNGKLPVVPAAGLPVGDVRDVARAVARAVAPGRGPRRYMLGGTYVSFSDLVGSIADLAGVQVAPKVANPRLLLALARCADAVQRVVPWKLPVAAAEAWVAVHDPHTDDSRAREDLGFVPRDLQTTIADTIEWLAAQRLVAASAAGQSDNNQPTEVKSWQS
jgi:dihydroflavonol-4-reductase